MSRHSERRGPSQNQGQSGLIPPSRASGPIGPHDLLPGVGKGGRLRLPRLKPPRLRWAEADAAGNERGGFRSSQASGQAVTAPRQPWPSKSLPPPSPKTTARPRVSAPRSPTPQRRRAAPIAPLASRSVPKLPAPPTGSEAVDPIALAKQSIADCQVKYQQIQDYTCTFYKRERIGGRLLPSAIMTMKARTNPHSVYFKFHQPNRGREAIYISGRNGGKILAHDVGIGKVLAGTMRLDPRGSMAMEDNRHPITEAGLGMLIDTVAKHWAIELTPEESQLSFNTNMQIDNRSCTMIESVHPRKNPGFLFHKVRLYIDHGLGLPIRFEAYDWPKHAGAAPELIEEYTYRNLRTNVGLREADFDPSWTRVVKARNQNEVDVLLDQLDPGEAESIVVAAAVHARLLLLDEKRCRRVASLQALEVTGLLGVLAEAKARGLITACQPILDDMLRLAGFWIGDDLRTHYLQGLNELD